MEENYSDTEHIMAGKRNDKFLQRIKTLRTLILILLCFGAGLSIFAVITWNNSSNEILRSLAVTGCVTIFASLIGLFGCNRCLRHLEVIKTTKMKESPGQEALLIFFYFNFLLFCSFLLFGTWCFFYQDDATAWLEAKYSDKESWERDFKGIQLVTVQNNIKLILTMAGIFSIIVGVINFACIYYSMKISMAFETIHTIVQVQNLVIVLLSFLIIYSGAIAKGYYSVPQVSEAEPEFLPQVFIFTGVAMILVAFLGFFASKAESKIGLISYTVFCIILLVNFLIFTVLLNYGSQALQATFEEKCNEVMPFFHKNFFQSFGCQNKYFENTTDPTYLTCSKDQIVTIWETNVDVPVEEQSDFYGCLNERCCIAMISFVKGKFNFLAAFCIVALFFILVAIMTSQYMYKKIKKYQTRILSHKNDNMLFLFMIAFTIGLGVLLKLGTPEGPKGMPQPDRSKSQITTDFWSTYDLRVDKSIGLGQLNLEGWWNFDRISLFQTEGLGEEYYHAEISIQSYPQNGEFRINGENNQTAHIDNGKGNVKLSGKVNDINRTMSELEYRPGCLWDKDNALELNLTIFNSRLLNETNETRQDSIQFGQPKRYRINLNLNSGISRQYRGKLVETNPNANGPSNQFKELASNQDVNLSVSLPYFRHCDVKHISVDQHGIFEFNMSILNNSIPYTMKIQAVKKNYNNIAFDYFVGGFPHSSKVEIGVYSFYTADNQNHNITGRLYEASSNKTFANDYTITVYQGYGEINQTSMAPYEKLNFYGNGEYYTGYYQLYDISPGPYVAVAEATGFIKNFQRFYSLPNPFPKQMRALPLVPELDEGELSLVLTWGFSPKDLDIHVEFVASPTISCKCDFSQHQCGGVKYMTDTVHGGDRGSDVIKFNYIGDFQYLVYVSLFKHKASPKASNTTQSDVSLPESQAQLKIFAPYYSWPVYIFDVPAAAANPTQNYWSVFCFNGKDGLRNIVPLNSLSSGAPDVSTCHQIYGEPDFLVKKEQEETEKTPNP